MKSPGTRTVLDEYHVDPHNLKCIPLHMLEADVEISWDWDGLVYKRHWKSGEPIPDDLPLLFANFAEPLDKKG